MASRSRARRFFSTVSSAANGGPASLNDEASRDDDEGDQSGEEHEYREGRQEEEEAWEDQGVGAAMSEAYDETRNALHALAVAHEAGHITAAGMQHAAQSVYRLALDKLVGLWDPDTERAATPGDVIAAVTPDVPPMLAHGAALALLYGDVDTARDLLAHVPARLRASTLALARRLFATYAPSDLGHLSPRIAQTAQALLNHSR